MKPAILFLVLILFTSAVSHAQIDDTLAVHEIMPVSVNAFHPITKIRSTTLTFTQRITREQIASSPATSLSELVSSFLPAESTDMEGLTGGVELRGFSPSGLGTNRYTLMLQNGIRIGTYNAAATSIPRNSTVEIAKGPFSAIYGSGAMGGVINIVTPSSSGKISGNADISYGSYNTMGVGAGVGGSLGPKFDFDLSLDYLRRGDDYRTGGHNLLQTTDREKAVLIVPQSRDTINRNSTYDKTFATLRLAYDITPLWRLNLYNDLFYTPHALANGTLWGVYGKSDKCITRNSHKIDVSGKINRHTIKITPFLSFENSDSRDMGVNAQSDYRYNTYGISASDEIYYSRATFTFGIDNLSEQYSSTQRSLTSGNSEAPYIPDYTNTQTGLLAQMNLNAAHRRLTIIAGIRYDNIRFKTLSTPLLDNASALSTYNTINPNLCLQYKLPYNLRLHTSIGRAFLAPEAYKTIGQYTQTSDWGTYVYEGNPELKPESSVTWESGISYAPHNGPLQACVSLFITRHNNMIVETYGSVNSFENAKNASMQGLEITASYDIGQALRKSYSWLFYTSISRIFHSQVQTRDITAPRQYLSPTKATFGTYFSLKKFSAALSGQYISQKIEQNVLAYSLPPTLRPSITTPTLQTPDYITFNLTLTYKITKNLTTSIKTANLLDELYMQRDGYYLPGRTTSINLRLTF